MIINNVRRIHSFQWAATQKLFKTPKENEFRMKTSIYNMEACRSESSNSGKNRELMVLNPMSRISQHDAAVNEVNVTQRLARRLFYWSLSPYVNIIDNSVFRYTCYKNDPRNHEKVTQTNKCLEKPHYRESFKMFKLSTIL